MEHSKKIKSALKNDYLKTDKLMLKIIAIHWFIATFLSSQFFHTYLLGAVGGGVIFLITLIAYKNLKGTLYFRNIIAISIMLFSAIYIQQNLGRIEMHFHVFIGLAILVAYKDTTPILVAALTTIFHHLIFNYLQLANLSIFGEQIYIFNYACGIDIVLLHGFFVIAEFLVMGYLIKEKRNQFIELVEMRLQLEEQIVKNKESEKILIQQSKMAAMGEMIGNIAHQWRQPLNALGIILQKILYFQKKGALTEEKIEKSIMKSNKLIEQMSTTIDDFRNFFKPDKIKENFTMNSSIKESLNLMEANLKNNHISFHIEEKDQCKAFGYPSEFSQVVLNVISNAKDNFLLKEIQNPHIEIVISRDEKCSIVQIEDNGGGIPEDIILKVFDPYFTTKDKSNGTGIGLYMSKMIIEKNMNGKIMVENSSKGAIFTLRLPYLEKE